MVLTPPERGLFPVRLFPNDDLGFGWGTTRKGIGAVDRPEGYDRTANMDGGGDVLSPTFLYSYLYNGFGVERNPAAYLKSWQDTNGIPFVLSAWSTVAYIFKDGVLVSEADATGNLYGGSDFHDDGATGTALFYAGTTDTASGAVTLLNKRTQGGLWTENAVAVNAKYVVSAGGALYRSTSDFLISKCPAGSDPFVLGSWGTGIRVGTNSAKMVNAGAIGSAPIFFKEDGIYVYVEADTRFENRFPVFIHPNNFGGLESDGAGGLLTVTATGDIIHINQFGAINVIYLEHDLNGKPKPAGRDTPTGPIIDIAADGDTLYALMKPAYRLVQPVGLKVLKATGNATVSACAFTDGSANVVDGSSTTNLDVSALVTATGHILIGFDAPFLALELNMLSAEANSNAAGVSARISTGADTWLAAGVQDGTNQNSNAALSQSAVVAILLQSNIAGWVKATYNGISKYWLDLTYNANLSATVKIHTVRIVVQRPAPQFSRVAQVTSPSAWNLPSWEASGMLGKVLVGTKTAGGYVFDDLITLNSVSAQSLNAQRTPGSNKIAVCPVGTGASSTRSLVVAARDHFVQYPLPYANSAANTPYAVLATWDDVGSLKGPPLHYPSTVDLIDVGRCRLRFIEIIGRNLTEGLDYWGFSWRWNDRMAWDTAAKLKGTSVLFAVDDGHGGTLLSTCFTLFDAVPDPVGPSGYEIIAWLEQDVGERESSMPEETRALPEVA